MARIGLLSDSHGRAAVTRQAVAILVEQGAELLVHLGDIESPQVLDELLVPGTDGSVLPVHVVFGNVDYDAEDLGRYARSLGIEVAHPVGTLTFDGRELVFMHGHDGRAMAQALLREVAWLCSGHTHRPGDVRQGATRLINPGALHRAPQYTVALLDTAGDELRFYSVPRD